MLRTYLGRSALLAGVCCLALAYLGCSGGSSSGAAGSSAKIDRSSPPESQVLQAAQNGDVKSLKALIGSNPELVNAREPGSQKTPLHLAGESDGVDAVKFLLEKGANPLAEDDQGRPPAQCAEEARASQPVTTLLGKAAKSARDASGVAQ
jgi:hypothetical protein